ncbi:MAG: asparaginase [Proteobacteria bacterium]|nr:asparaginase [Pseudomonadota bacterium]
MPRNPLQVQYTRGELAESEHRVHALWVDEHGRDVEAWGDSGRLVCPRSCLKPVQALPLVLSKAFESAPDPLAAVAIACASHKGQPLHLEFVESWLKNLGRHEDDLVCAPQRSRRIDNNCSGKHTGFLAACGALGFETRGYHDWTHPLQSQIRDLAGALSGMDWHKLPYGTDGCGIPTLATPLRSLARAMASMADPSGLSSKHADAAQRIRAAMNAEPFMVAGSGRFCTLVNGALPGVAQVKTGAEGVFCGMLPTLGLGVAIKMWDGAARAAEVAMASLLSHLGVLPADKHEELLHPPIRNVVGLLVGEMRPAKSWLG